MATRQQLFWPFICTKQSLYELTQRFNGRFPGRVLAIVVLHFSATVQNFSFSWTKHRMEIGLESNMSMIADPMS